MFIATKASRKFGVLLKPGVEGPSLVIERATVTDTGRKYQRATSWYAAITSTTMELALDLSIVILGSLRTLEPEALTR